MTKKKEVKSVTQSKGKMGAVLVMAAGVSVIGYGLFKGVLDAGSALSALTTFGVGLGIYGVRDKQERA